MEKYFICIEEVLGGGGGRFVYQFESFSKLFTPLYIYILFHYCTDCTTHTTHTHIANNTMGCEALCYIN